MSRILTPSTPIFKDVGDTVHPVAKGGFGANTYEGIKNAIGAVGIGTGTVPIGSDGKVDLSTILPPGQVMVAEGLILDGPEYFRYSVETEITIVNFNQLANYTLSSNCGAFLRSDKIVIPALQEVDTAAIIINGRIVNIPRESIDVVTPSLTFVGSKISTTDFKVQVTGSAFSSLSNAGHLNTDWQFSKNQEFTDILFESRADATDKLIKDFTSSYNGVVYVRARYRSDASNVSHYSSVVTIEPSVMTQGIAKPTLTVDGYIDQDLKTVLELKSSAFISSNQYAHKSSRWEVATDANFQNKIVDVTSDTSLVAYNAFGAQGNYLVYVRVTYIDTFGGTNTCDPVIYAIDNAKPYVGEVITSSITFDGTIYAGDNYGFINIAEDAKLAIYALGSIRDTSTDYELRVPVIDFSDQNNITIKYLPRAAETKAAGTAYGYSCSINSAGNVAAVSAANISCVYLYVRNATTGEWTQTWRSPTYAYNYGHRVSISADGTMMTVTQGWGESGKGVCYIYSLSSGTATLLGTVTSPGAIDNDVLFSTKLSANGSLMVTISIYYQNKTGKIEFWSKSGSSYTSRTVMTVTTINAELTALGYTGLPVIAMGSQLELHPDGDTLAVNCKTSKTPTLIIFNRTPGNLNNSVGDWKVAQILPLVSAHSVNPSPTNKPVFSLGGKYLTISNNIEPFYNSSIISVFVRNDTTRLYTLIKTVQGNYGNDGFGYCSIVLPDKSILGNYQGPKFAKFTPSTKKFSSIRYIGDSRTTRDANYAKAIAGSKDASTIVVGNASVGIEIFAKDEGYLRWHSTIAKPSTLLTFGATVGASGNGEVIAAYGVGSSPNNSSIRVYERNANKDFVLSGTLYGASTTDIIASIIKFTNDGMTMICGEPNYTARGTASGGLGLYKKENGSWIKITVLTNSTGKAYSSNSIGAISDDGEWVVIGIDGVNLTTTDESNNWSVSVHRKVANSYSEVQNIKIARAPNSGTSGAVVCYPAISPDNKWLAIAVSYRKIGDTPGLSSIEMYENVSGVWTWRKSIKSTEYTYTAFGHYITFTRDGKRLVVMSGTNPNNIKQQTVLTFEREDNWGTNGSTIATFGNNGPTFIYNNVYIDDASSMVVTNGIIANDNTNCILAVS